MNPEYTTRDVAEIVGVSEARVRYWAQTGLVSPTDRSPRRPGYTFGDLVSVKAAKELLERGVAVRQVRKHLDALRTQWPQLSQPITRLRVRADDARLLVSDGEKLFEPLTGQLVLDFGVEDLARPPAKIEPLPSRQEGAWRLFVSAGECEERGDEEAALEAYQRALAADPAFAAVHTNLGNLFYKRQEHGQAREHYEKALALDPEQPEARFNLGNLYDDLGEHEAARRQWCLAVSVCPEFADAHYNLGISYSRDGDRLSARLHLGRYVALRPDDTDAAELLEQL